MTATDKPTDDGKRIRRYAASLLTIWTLVICASLFWSLMQQEKMTSGMARAEALSSFNKDLVYRRWAASHGGVYVPATPETPPNPYLAHVPERDLTSPGGRDLTLVNPAYMTRQVHTLAEGQYGARGHITSLNPLRPENRPDDWERAALESFERGEAEQVSVQEMGGETYLRFMRPLPVEEQCLKCHAHQGYKVGDLRGGISVSVPMGPYLAIGRQANTAIFVTHGLAWALGVLLVGVGVVSVRRHVEERDRAEASLRDSERHFRSLFENMLNGYAYCRMIYDGEGRPQDFLYLDVNRAFEALTGLRGVVGKKASEAIPGIRESTPELFEIYGRVARTGSPEKFESYLAPLGMWFAVSVYSPAQDHFVAVFDVITERKRAEEALRLSEEKFSKAFKASPVWVSLTTVEDGRFLEVNDTFTTVTGYTREEAIGRTSFDLNFWLDPERDRQRALELFHRDGGFHNLEMPMRFKDGQVHTMLWSVDPIEFEGRQCFINVLVDISDQKNAQREKTRLEAQLRQSQKMEAVGTLAGGIAHDFNNILGAVMGYTELAQEMAREGRPHDAELSMVLDAAERARKLVGQILTFSRKSEPDARPLGLNKSVRQALQMLEHTLPKMIAIETHLAPDLDLVNADPNQMEQVIVNLAANAKDAMPEGGRLVIETGNEFLDEEYCRRHLDVRPGRYVLLTVSDTGEGIAKDNLNKIFDPFFTTKEVGQGTGLGLATVYGIVKGHGGHIFCYSEKQMGTSFKVYLPAYEATAPAPEMETVLPERLLRGSETILLVDDEQALRDLGSLTLRSMGYSVLTASSGEEALYTYKNRAGGVDLVVMDLGMPGMGGQKAMAEILALDPQAKVVIASGYSANGQVKSALDSGAAGYVAKPFRRLDLLAAVRDALDKDGPLPGVS